MHLCISSGNENKGFLRVFVGQSVKHSIIALETSQYNIYYEPKFKFFLQFDLKLPNEKFQDEVLEGSNGIFNTLPMKKSKKSLSKSKKVYRSLRNLND